MKNTVLCGIATHRCLQTQIGLPLGDKEKYVPPRTEGTIVRPGGSLVDNNKGGGIGVVTHRVIEWSDKKRG